MSNNNDEGLLCSMCDMFPNLDPSLVEMVLSEYKEVEVVMDYLLELSTAAKAEIPIGSASRLGFDTIASFLDGTKESLTSSRIPEQTSDKSPKTEEFQAEVCTDMPLSNDLDSLLDEALNMYRLRNDYNSMEQCDLSTTNVPDSVGVLELVQSTSVTSPSLLTNNVPSQPLKDQESEEYESSVTLDIPSTDTQNSAGSSTASNFSKAQLMTKSSRTDLNPKLLLASDSEKCSNFITTAPEILETRERTENPNEQVVNQMGIEPTLTSEHVSSIGSRPSGLTQKWNLFAPSFHPVSSQQHIFFTPVVTSPTPWNLALSEADGNGGICFNHPVPPYSWNVNSIPPNVWPNDNTKLNEPGPQIVPQNLKKTKPFVGKVLILLRGAPGSGKSTLARMLLQQNPTGIILSTDEYFCKDGEYRYDANLLEEAHDWNHKRAKEAFEKNVSPIIIDNTNLQGWEMKPYVSLAMKCKYKVTFREPDTWWKYKPKELERRNRHGVTKEKIVRMLEHFERVTVNSILNLKRPKASELKDHGQIKKTHDKNGKIMPQALKKEDTNVYSAEKTDGESVLDNAVTGTASQGIFLPQVSKDFQDSLLDDDKQSVIKNQCNSDVGAIKKCDGLMSAKENINICNNMKTNNENDLLSQGSNEDEIAIKEHVSNVDGVSLPLCERPELLNFVGDWPVEYTMSQRIPRNRRKVSKNNEAVESCGQQLSEVVKLSDTNSELLKSDTLEQDLLQQQYKGLDNFVAFQSTCDNEISNLCPEENLSELKDQICSSETLLEKMQEPPTGQKAALDGANKNSTDLQMLTEVNTDLKKHVLLNLKEDEFFCETEKKKRSKRNCRHRKLALTFTNTCSDSSQTEEIQSIWQSQEQTGQSYIGPSKYSQTEPQEFALLWRIEKKNIDISDSVNVLTGKLDRFKSNSVNERSDMPESIPYRVVHHKSTFVEEEEIDSLGDIDSLNILCKLFRSVSVDVLKDLFERCNKDIVWASNLLLDSGEKFYRDEDCQTEDYYRGGEHTHLEMCSNSNEGSDVANDEHSDVSFDNKKESIKNSQAAADCCILEDSMPLVTEKSENENVFSVIDVNNSDTIKEQSELATNTKDLDQKMADRQTIHTIWSSNLEKDPFKIIYSDVNTVVIDSALEAHAVEEHSQEVILSDAKNSPKELELHSEIPVVHTSKEQEESDNISFEEVAKIKTNNSESLSKDCVEFSHLELSITPELAFQLSELFGPVGIDPGSLTIEDCMVHIDLNLAKAIHSRWKESIMEKHNQETLSYQLLFEDCSHNEHFQLDRIIQDESSRLGGNDFVHSEGTSDLFPFMDQWNAQTRKVSLRQIMSEEIALQQQEDQKKSPLRKNCAIKLKEKQLFEMFPSMEQKLLTDIFMENNYSLEKSAQFICTVLESDPVQNVVAQDLKQAVTDTLDKTKEKKSKQDKEICAERYYQDLDFPEYDDFRAEALLYRKKQQESYRKAAEAHHRGMKQVATYYAQQGYLYGQKMKEENHRAALQIFQRANEFLLPENILDLHGLHVDEAMKHLRRVLQEKMDEYKQKGGKSYLSVITGRGNHSQGGVARIKPAVVDYLTNQNFRFQEIRPGVLRITLK
ncbi:NEDD4-binding protein 2 [Rhinophrynus dorsalis]